MKSVACFNRWGDVSLAQCFVFPSDTVCSASCIHLYSIADDKSRRVSLPLHTLGTVSSKKSRIAPFLKG